MNLFLDDFWPLFPDSWVNKLNEINGIEKNYEIALCIFKEGQRKSGTVHVCHNEVTFSQ